jgi:YHS domain-containing protein
MGKDPVCGMIVDVMDAAAIAEYGGVRYYFCAPGCKKAFDRDPKKYIDGQDVATIHTQMNLTQAICDPKEGL